MKKEGVVESPPSRENAAGLATRHPRDLSKAESDRVGGWAGHPSGSLRAGFLEKRVVVQFESLSKRKARRLAG
jgi:hypothetical protein